MKPSKPQRSSAAANTVPRNADGVQGQRPRGERLRLGLTGLGAIFLLVMVVAAGLKPAARPAAGDPQGESLAVLGVAPGAAGPAVPPHP